MAILQTTPSSKAHPMNPPLCHSKVPYVPPGQQATVEDASAEESDDDVDEEVAGEENTPWTHPSFTAGVFIPAPDRGEAAAALADLRLVIAPLRDTGIGHKY